MLSRLAAAIADLTLGLAEWRVWWVLAYNDILQRYRRSSLGQLWLTISMAAMIAGVGMVYALIFDQPLERLSAVLRCRPHRLELAGEPRQRPRHLLHQRRAASPLLSDAALGGHLPHHRPRLHHQRA